MTAARTPIGRPGRLGAGGLAAALGLALFGCSSASPAATATTTTRPAATSAAGLPLAAGLAGASDTGASSSGDPTFAALPMGHLDEVSNTFWQLFTLARGATRWRLSTPPGVADNGGLFASLAPGGALVVGFGVSNALGFSPVARTTTGGRSFAAGVLPTAIAPVPSAITEGAGGGLLAVVGRTGSSIVASGGSLSSWHTVATLQSLAGTLGGTCRPAAVTAVAAGARGRSFVGVSCPGSATVGLLTGAVGDWRPVALRLAGEPSGSSTSVVRLEAKASGALALVAAFGARPSLTLVHLSTSGAAPVASAPYRLPAGDRLVATGTTATGGLFAAYGPGATATAAVVFPASSGAPSVLSGLPAGTATLAFAPGTVIWALTASGSTFAAWRLAPGAARFAEVQRNTVPIQYGSSS